MSAAILPELAAEGPLPPARAAALSSAVQIGFVAGALGLAAWGLADRRDPRRVMAACAWIAAAANLAFILAPVGGAAQVALRALTGACLAGVYPVGMKIAIGWGARDRGLLIGLVVAAVTLGSAAPHLLALAGGPTGGRRSRPPPPWPGSGRARALRRARARARPRRHPRPGRAPPRLDRPAHPPRLSRLSRPHVGALRLLGLDRRGVGRGLRRDLRRGAGGRHGPRAHLRRHRARRPRLRPADLVRRPDRQGAEWRGWPLIGSAASALSPPPPSSTGRLGS